VREWTQTHKKDHVAPSVLRGRSGRSGSVGGSGLFLFHAQFLQFVSNSLAVISCFDSFVYVKDLAIFPYIVGPAIGHATGIEAAKCVSELLFGVAQNRIIEIEALGEVCVLLDSVDACGEVCNIKVPN